MKHHAPVFFILASLVIAPGILTAGNDEAIDKDRKLMAGTWRIISYEREGKKAPDDLLEKTRAILTLDGVGTVKRDGKIIAQATLKIDPTKKPKQSTSTYNEGELMGHTVLGIYEVDGDNMKACYALPGQNRPTEFSSKPGSGHVLIIYERDKQ